MYKYKCYIIIGVLLFILILLHLNIKTPDVKIIPPALQSHIINQKKTIGAVGTVVGTTSIKPIKYEINNNNNNIKPILSPTLYKVAKTFANQEPRPIIYKTVNLNNNKNKQISVRTYCNYGNKHEICNIND